MRLNAVRCFARYRVAEDARTEIPSSHLITGKPKRARPYIYSEREIETILAEVLLMPHLSLLKRRTLHCVLGLLCVTGMRVSEVIELQESNIDLSAGIVTIEKSKFGKSRLIPLHETTICALQRYREFRDSVILGPRAGQFFLVDDGSKLKGSGLRWAFNRLLERIGLREVGASRGPRLHDFRHSFAIKTLLDWYRSGEEVERRLPTLSTYLGHSNVGCTYWYLTACPELMGHAVALIERRWEATL